jgi:YihY family inner membrane protein
MAWTTSDKVMQLRERSHPFDVFAEMMDGWRRHLSGRNASLLAFFSFLSIFPLMLAAVTILGFVLHDNEQRQQQIIDSAASEIPVLGQTLADNPGSIDGSVLALLIGLGGALWASTKAFVGLQSALDDAWEVGVDDRDGLPAQRGKALLGVAIIAFSQVGTFVIAGIVSAARLPAFSNAALIGATVVVNVAVITAMYRVLTSYPATWGDVWLGGVFAGVVFSALQHFGTLIVTRFAKSDNEALGTINTILGLLAWLSLIGITVIMCAELNAARKRLRVEPNLGSGPNLDIAIRA